MDEKQKFKKVKKKEKKEKQYSFFSENTLKIHLVYISFIFFIIILFVVYVIFFDKKNHKDPLIIVNNSNLDNLNQNDSLSNYPDINNINYTKFRDYFNIAKNGTFLYANNLERSNETKISVIIALYNSIRYINTTLKSIQNQKMKEIEIIIVDDCSKDGSLSYIQEAQKTDPRIIILKNEKNMGILYSKSIGIFQAKGKYIFPIDHDDTIVIDDLFDSIYQISEEGKYDILEFSWLGSEIYDIQEKNIVVNPCCHHKIGIEIYQPKLRQRYSRNDDGNFHLQDLYLWGKLILKDIYIKALNELGEEGWKRRFFMHEDTITSFFLFKLANSFKKIDKIGICHFGFKDSASAEKERFKLYRIETTCLSYLNFVDLLYKHVENTTEGRDEAFYEFKVWIIYTKCRYFRKSRKLAFELAKTMIKDTLLNLEHKKIIKKFFHINFNN